MAPAAARMSMGMRMASWWKPRAGAYIPLAAARAVRPIATRMPLMVRTAVQRLWRRARSRLAPPMARARFQFASGSVFGLVFAEGVVLTGFSWVIAYSG